MAKEYRQNASYNDIVDDDYKNDPEAGARTKKLRLPYALCKSNGIPIQDWWTPRDAWDALRKGGIVDDVSEEYKEFFENLKKQKRERQKEFDKAHPDILAQKKARAKQKKLQLADLEHNPDKGYKHQDGKIAGVEKGEPMDFEQANNGNCNPYFNKTNWETGHEYIGYRTNCQTCVATYFARRKGYNVKALPNLNNWYIDKLSLDVSCAYIDSNGKHPERKKVRDIGELSMNAKAGSIHALRFSYIGRTMGHIVIFEKDQNGNSFLYDPQSNLKYEEAEFKTYQKGKSNFKAMDLTNCVIDEEYCDKIMNKR